MFTFRADTARHGIAELRQRPVADARLGIRRNIGNVEGAKRRRQCVTAGQDLEILALGTRCGMTADTAACPEQFLAIGDIRAAQIGPIFGRMRLRLGKSIGRGTAACHHDQTAENNLCQGGRHERSLNFR